mmetsp:Transcript_77564/g.167772  ORF Transcript_77564/g.167772 Transcript_77564/m.167772 type:complete len:219 (+) Transcript_77564:467-1123(+)
MCLPIRVAVAIFRSFHSSMAFSSAVIFDVLVLVMLAESCVIPALRSIEPSVAEAPTSSSSSLSSSNSSSSSSSSSFRSESFFESARAAARSSLSQSSKARTCLITSCISSWMPHSLCCQPSWLKSTAKSCERMSGPEETSWFLVSSSSSSSSKPVSVLTTFTTPSKVPLMTMKIKSPCTLSGCGGWSQGPPSMNSGGGFSSMRKFVRFHHFFQVHCWL